MIQLLNQNKYGCRESAVDATRATDLMIAGKVVIVIVMVMLERELLHLSREQEHVKIVEIDPVVLYKLHGG